MLWQWCKTGPPILVTGERFFHSRETTATRNSQPKEISRTNPACLPVIVFLRISSTEGIFRTRLQHSWIWRLNMHLTKRLRTLMIIFLWCSKWKLRGMFLLSHLHCAFHTLLLSGLFHDDRKFYWYNETESFLTTIWSWNGEWKRFIERWGLTNSLDSRVGYKYIPKEDSNLGHLQNAPASWEESNLLFVLSDGMTSTRGRWRKIFWPLTTGIGSNCDELSNTTLIYPESDNAASLWIVVRQLLDSFETLLLFL